MTTTSQQTSRYNVLVSINEPALAMTARYDNIQATDSLDASRKATEAAAQEFGQPARWTTERIEAA